MAAPIDPRHLRLAPPVRRLIIAAGILQATDTAAVLARGILIGSVAASTINGTLRPRLLVILAVVVVVYGAMSYAGARIKTASTGEVIDLFVRTVVPAGVAIVVSIIAVIGTVILSPLAALTLTCGFLGTGLLSPWLARRANRRSQRLSSRDDLITSIDRTLSNRTEYEAAGLGQTLIDDVSRASRAASTALATAQRPLALVTAFQTWPTGLTSLVVLLIAVTTYSGDPTWLGMLIMFPLAASSPTVRWPRPPSTQTTLAPQHNDLLIYSNRKRSAEPRRSPMSTW